MKAAIDLVAHRRMLVALGLVLFFVFALAAPAGARVVMTPAQVAGNSSVTVSLRVVAGCIPENGPQKPTTKVEMTVPAGAIVRPLAEAGWKVKPTSGEFQTPVKVGDQTVTQGVRKIVWSAQGGALEPPFVGDLTFILTTPPPGRRLIFPTVQTCRGAKTSWTQVRKPGEEGVLDRPAPVLQLVRAPRPPAGNQPPPAARDSGGGSGILTYLALLAGLGGLGLGGYALKRVIDSSKPVERSPRT